MAALAGRAALEGMKRRFVDVEIADVGVFRLREMSGTERDRFDVSLFNETTETVDGRTRVVRKVNPVLLRARMVALCLVGEDGKRLYGDDEVAMLSDTIPSSALEKLADAARTLNGIGEQAEEGAAKNSVSGPSAASTSA